MSTAPSGEPTTIGSSGAGQDIPASPWARFAAKLDAIPAPEFARRVDQVRRDLRDSDPHVEIDRAAQAPRAELDPVPLVIADQEWDALAQGPRQRARLLDAVLADCYGPQRLLRDGLLDAAAVLAHPGFLRPLHYTRPPGGRWMRAYAADLVRAADGRWLCLADRGQAPSGDGSALEARLATKRIMPEAYRDLRVRRLAPYFVALRRTLTTLAPRGNDNPRIALMTPGPYSPSHGEHAFLARYLGYPLVEGGDLVVRDDEVSLKTLGGLQPIDVLLRRQEDSYCDPLELRNDSTLGVPGLVQAARNDRIAILNPLGSGLSENRALLPALPHLCRTVLGEDLALASPRSWWCGDALAEVESQVDAIALLPTVAGLRPGRFVPRELSAAARAALLAQVRERPHAWIAQELIDTSAVPTWSDGRLATAPFTLRAFAISDGDDWTAMSGGRCAVSSERGGARKDVWILAEHEVDEVSLLPARNQPVELRRGSIALPSRVADNLYWIGRYAERAEGAARLARAVAERFGEDPRSALGRELTALEAMAAKVGIAPTREDGEPVEAEALLLGIVGDRGLRGSLAGLRRAALAVRDRISSDTARIVARLAADTESLAEQRDARGFDAAVSALSALAGMCTENTTRGPGWRFLDSGRRIERALFAVEVLSAPFASGGADAAVMPVLLELADSAITYRSRYLASLQPHAVLDLLLTDDSNPRSVLFQLEALAGHLGGLPREQALPTQAEKLALGARTWVRVVDPLELCRLDETGGRPALTHLLDHLGSDLTLLSDAITAQWLDHSAGPRALMAGIP
jgi:uncharacterized circularly permuted ATP-grasp superfamily protein/uncharacterized alpha-E superfamily protein